MPRCFSKPVNHCFIAVFSLFFCRSAQAQVVLEAHHIDLKKGITLNLKIPKGYNVSVAAEGMRRLRFLAKSPDGQLFGTDMFSLADNKRAKFTCLIAGMIPLKVSGKSPFLQANYITQTR